MKEYWRLLRQQTSLLTYGVALTFMSSVGQTFLVSLFVPYFIASFALSEGGFGVLYSGATLASAFLLPWIGRRMDRDHLHHFTLGVVGLLAASAFLMAGAWHVSVLAVALLGVRLGGQGLSSHTALTAMARYFEAGRGRALSISSLGFPLGEGVLPLLLTYVIGWWGWRSAWVVLGVAVVAFGPVLVRLLLRSGIELHPVKAAAATRHREDAEEAKAKRVDEEAKAAGISVTTRRPPPTDTPADVLKDARFWLVLPAVVLPAFWGTGFILYQTAIAGTKGWSAPLMASAFVGLAGARIVFTLGAGGIVDRFTARRLFPLTVLPMATGLALLGLLDAWWVAYAFMALLGVTFGLNGATETALWAELYGTRHLGAIKSMLTSVIVVSTALSPPLVGFLVEAGWLGELLAVAVATSVLGSLLATRLWVGRKA